MKFLIVLACAFAVASAGHLLGAVGHGGYAGHGGLAVLAGPVYAGPQHLPVINGEGVPVDTADVQHARAAHLSQQATVHARNGDGLGFHGAGFGGGHGGVAVLAGPVGYAGLGLAGHGGAAAAAAAAAAAGFGGHGVAHGPAAYPTSHVVPATVNGVPLNTPEVAAATANHLAAHHEALARTAHAGHGAHGHYRKRRGIYGGGYHGAAGLGLGGLGGLGLAYHGAAGALLAGAHAGGAGVYAAGAGAYAAPQPIYHGPQHLPVINAEGVPVDTADVQHARAAHLTHRATVQHRNGDFAYGGYGGYGAGYGGHGGYGGFAGHGGHGHY